MTHRLSRFVSHIARLFGASVSLHFSHTHTLSYSHTQHLTSVCLRFAFHLHVILKHFSSFRDVSKRV